MIVEHGPRRFTGKAVAQPLGVVAVAVGVHQQDHSAVAQLADVEVVADAGAECFDEVLDRLVGHDFGGRE